ncbi:MAG TPA: hypothetical protein VMW25_04805 [Clostridia bacterium]|nr:hypothetical protein [Clostridia bacterium]
MKGNLTVSIDVEVLKEVKARRGLNVSGLVEDKLKEFLEED